MEGGGGGISRGATGGTQGALDARTRTRSAEDLQKARESRAAEALQMKDEQLRILTVQNKSLLESLDKVEDEANAIQMEKLAVEEENRQLRDQNFELQAKARTADAQVKKVQSEMADKEKQLKIMTDQNSELLRLLESEEAQTARLQADNEELKKELDEIRAKHSSLLVTAKTHEEMAARAAREGQLRAEEIRLLRAEVEQLKQAKAELEMKTQVEVEALQEQLRVRKEKQYQLLEKLQGQEEARRQAEDQVAATEDKLRMLHSKNAELETQVQQESRGRRTQEELNKQLNLDNEALLTEKRELQAALDASEKERLRLEAEARDSGEQLREMAEKTFALLERLKLAELGKTKAIEALKKKEQEYVALQKKNARLTAEAVQEAKKRAKAENDNKALQDQVRELQKHNFQISQQCKTEARLRVKEHEENKEMSDKLKTITGRMNFMLNKMQTDEEARNLQREEAKRMEAQLRTTTEKCEELRHKLEETNESNRIMSQATRLKQEELQQLQQRHRALEKVMQQKEKEWEEREFAVTLGGGDSAGEDRDGGAGERKDDSDSIRQQGGRGCLIPKYDEQSRKMSISGRNQQQRDFVKRHRINHFLRADHAEFRRSVTERFAMVYSLLFVAENDQEVLKNQIREQNQHIEHLQQTNMFSHERLATEEQAKRRILLRYVGSIHRYAANKAGFRRGDFDDDEDDRGIQLPESLVTDEEVSALTASLSQREDEHIEELNLRGNLITDDGAASLCSLLRSTRKLQLVDLRKNKISRQKILEMSTALEANPRSVHVHVSADGKIVALGSRMSVAGAPRTGGGGASGGGGAGGGGANLPPVQQHDGPEVVCVIDVRENLPAPSAAVMTSYLQAQARSTRTLGGSGSSPINKSAMASSSGSAGAASGTVGADGTQNPRPHPLQLAPVKKKNKKALLEAQRKKGPERAAKLQQKQQQTLERGWTESAQSAKGPETADPNHVSASGTFRPRSAPGGTAPGRHARAASQNHLHSTAHLNPKLDNSPYAASLR